jgi:excisionase family DNA binding protein
MERMSSSAGLKKRLYTVPEAAVYLGHSVWSIRALIWGGVLPSVRVRKRVHLDVVDMEKLIEQSKVVEEAPVRVKKGGKVAYGPVSSEG